MAPLMSISRIGHTKAFEMTTDHCALTRMLHILSRMVIVRIKPNLVSRVNGFKVSHGYARKYTPYIVMLGSTL